MTVVVTKVAASADDGRSPNFSTLQTDRTYFTFNQLYYGFVRFILSVPQGATVNSATLTLYTASAFAGNSPASIGCDAADNSLAPTSGPDLRGRPRVGTTVVTASSPGALNYQNDLTVTAPVSAIISRPGWAAGNALTLIWAGDQGQTDLIDFSAFDQGNPAYYPTLTVDYTPAGGGGPTTYAKTGRAAGVRKAIGAHATAHPATIVKTGKAATVGAPTGVQNVVANGTIFADGFESGTFTRWRSCQWTGRNDTCQLYDGTSDYSATVVADGARPQVARFEVRDGDEPPFGGGERVEIASPPATEAAVGVERWLVFDMKFDATFPTVTDWCVVHQWRTSGDDTGSGPVTLAVDPDDHLYLENPNPDPEWSHLDAGPVVRGTWRRYVLHVKFSTDKTVGFVELSIDGTVVVPLTHSKTVRSGFVPADYLKFGIYRSNAETATAITYLDNVSLSDTAPVTVSDETGGGAATAAGVGSKIVTHPTTVAKSGGADCSGVGGGTKVVSHASVYAKTGGAVTAGVASGVETVAHPAVTSQTGAAVTLAAATGLVTVAHPTVTSRTGGAAATATSSGTRVLVHTKAGGVTVLAAASSLLTVTHPAATAVTGGAAAVAASGGRVAVDSATGTSKAGGAVAVASADGDQAVTHPVTTAKTGGAAVSATASGVETVASAVVHVKTGGAAARAAGVGAGLHAEAGTHAESGGAAASAAASGTRAVAHPAVHAKTGGAGVLATPGGVYTVTRATTRAKTGGGAAYATAVGHRPAVTVKAGGATAHAGATGSVLVTAVHVKAGGASSRRVGAGVVVVVPVGATYPPTHAGAPSVRARSAGVPAVSEVHAGSPTRVR